MTSFESEDEGAGVYTKTTTQTASSPGSRDFSDRVNEEKTWRQVWQKATLSQLFGSITKVGILELINAFLYYFCRDMAVSNGLGTGAISIICGIMRFLTLACFLREGAGYVDPLLSLGTTLLGRLGPYYWPFVFVHFVAQILGACLASAFTMAFTPGNFKGFGLGATGPTEPGYTPGQGIGIETVLTALYYFVLFYLMVSEYEINMVELALRRKTSVNFATVAALFHTAFTWVTFSISGGNLNWFTNFWSRAISDTLDANWWVPFFGPLLGWIMGFCLFGFWYWMSEISFHTIHIHRSPLVKTKEG